MKSVNQACKNARLQAIKRLAISKVNTSKTEKYLNNRNYIEAFHVFSDAFLTQGFCLILRLNH
jgi:hypothetical protein